MEKWLVTSPYGFDLEIEGETPPSREQLDAMFSKAYGRSKAEQPAPANTAPKSTATLSQAPEKSLVARGIEGARRALSPILGPTESQRLTESVLSEDESGKPAYRYRPMGGKLEEEGLLPALSHPIIPIPKMDASNPIVRGTLSAMKPGVPPESLAAVINTGIGFAEFAESPLGIATLGAGAVGVSAKAIAGGYAVDVGLKVPEQATQAGELSVTGTPQETQEAILGTAASVALTGILGAKPAAAVFSSITKRLRLTEAPKAAIAIEETETSSGSAKESSALEADVTRYQELQREMVAKIDAKEVSSPEFQSLWSESEQIKNRYGGMPPQSSAPKSTETVAPQAVEPEPKSQLAADASEIGDAKMRKSAARATTAPEIPEPVQERIATAPESFYTPQSVPSVEKTVGSMTEVQLASVASDSNIYVASKLEQAGRHFKAGNNEAGYQVFVELEKQGTSFGQNVNQFKLLAGTLPEHVTFVVNEKLKKAGRDPLTPDQATEVTGLAAKSKTADGALDAATETWRKNPTDENAAAAEKSLDAANEAALELQRKVSRFQPRSTAAILKSVLQGNLLTTISQAANLFGNVSFLPFRIQERTGATALDILDSYLRGKPRELAVQPVAGTAQAAKGLVVGAKQIPDILLRGTGDTIKGETRAGLHPLRAWMNQFAKNPEAPLKGGKLALQDRLNLAIEGTFGVPAEAMLRLLGAGDAPFRESARARVIAEQAKLKSVPRDQWSMAQKFPELFFDRATMELIKTETMAAVFQRQSPTLNALTNWIRGRGDLFDLGIASVAPYKVTPWNILGQILSYNPIVAMAKTALEASRGNSRAAKLAAARFVVGSELTLAGWWLYQNGLLAPSLDERDEAQKARLLSQEVLPPNHINLSGLGRALTGGDPAFKAKDETVDIFRAGGLAGSFFYMIANIGRQFERQPAPDTESMAMEILSQSALEQARFGLNQSFLQGVEGLLSAVREGNVDTYLQRYANTVLSIPLPNTLSAISRAQRDYRVDLKADTLPKRVENLVRNRLGFTTLDDYLPLQRDLWGRPLRETPEGRNALVYHFFDITKNKQVTDDPIALELYRLWRKTADSKVIPSIPEKTITVDRKTRNLTRAQHSRYVELVGARRREIAEAVVINPEFYALDDNTKISILDRVYDAGQKAGRAEFLSESPILSEQPAKAGFVAPK